LKDRSVQLDSSHNTEIARRNTLQLPELPTAEMLRMKTLNGVIMCFAYGSLLALATAMLFGTYESPGDEFGLPGLFVLIISIFSLVFSPGYLSLIAVFTSVLLLSTILIVKHGYEGCGRLRISLISCGTLLTILSGLVPDIHLLAGYWCWLVSFLLSGVAHLMLRIRSIANNRHQPREQKVGDELPSLVPHIANQSRQPVDLERSSDNY
jgi:hypothetical protein